YRVSVLKRALQDRDGKPLLTRHGWAANAELQMSVAPHVRRAEAAEVRLRYTTRERPTRFRPWNTAVELGNLARKAPPRPALPPPRPPPPRPPPPAAAPPLGRPPARSAPVWARGAPGRRRGTPGARRSGRSAPRGKPRTRSAPRRGHGARRARPWKPRV